VSDEGKKRERAPSKPGRRASSKGGRRARTERGRTIAQESETVDPTLPVAAAPGLAVAPAPRAPSRPSTPSLAEGARLAVFETTASHRVRAVEVCQALGYQVIAPATPGAMLAALRAEDGLDVVLVGLESGQAVIDAARAVPGRRPTIVAALSGPAALAARRCERAGADLFAFYPFSQDGIAAVLQAAVQLGLARSRALALEGAEEVLRQRLLRYGESDSVTGFQHFDFFKKLLVTELKRARRYGYSLAACLVAIDPWTDGEPSPTIARKLRTQVAAAVAAGVRDIDQPVDLAEDRFLVFLPYTDLVGAERVGRRVAAVVKGQGSLRDGDRIVRMSVSVGIAALRAGKPVSFARLMRDAQSAVRAAQLKGGGRVVVRT
jgi:diguanylate cyclase (GGDEF)-like protein